jgi:hypothetical protein
MVKPGEAPPDNMAVDEDGNPLAFTPEQTRDIVHKMIDEGEILAAIVRSKNGDLGVQVYGPPTRELLAILEQTTKAYRRVLKGH